MNKNIGLFFLTAISLVAVGCAKTDSGSGSSAAPGKQESPGTPEAPESSSGSETVDPLFTRFANARNLNSIYGVWDTSPVDGSEFETRAQFSPDLITFVSKCNAKGSPIYARTSAKARITRSTIEILDYAEKTELVRGISCTSSIKPGTYTYTVRNGQLFDTTDGSEKWLARKISDQ